MGDGGGGGVRERDFISKVVLHINIPYINEYAMQRIR